MATIFQHTQTNILVIPQALFDMQDIRVISHHQNSAILHKSLQQDLTDIEFYTNTPCLIYIENGREVITGSDNKTTELLAGDAVFIPQGLNLHSDFVRQTESLKAYLVFFDDRIIHSFLSQTQYRNSESSTQPALCVLADNPHLEAFFTSLHSHIGEPGYLSAKLHELLYLLTDNHDKATLFTSLSAVSTAPPKRNLTRLLSQQDIIRLSVSDLASLSGRSLSSFNRDFKQIYNMPPKQWLQEKRLSCAKDLLEQQEMSVTDTALNVGYDNVSNFIRAFKRQYGTTPKQHKATN
ncbi:AraC family transcriptional regulator [Aliamphritea hakodatensis]|uniref:AraC family transcriptional regulator n=1 Tax=Aliamphritea hakodatensis TaxID=2895352 RepID=UPI0022FD9CA8|nr:AraC family transcriptional regulator [Aliamphritea hakodatensis]